MKSKEENLVYRFEFDGNILKYKASRLSGLPLYLLNFNRELEIPINIVLSYQLLRKFGPFQVLKLTIHRYRFGNNLPNPEYLAPLLFVGKNSSLLKTLQRELDRNIDKTKRGTNIGLMDLNEAEIKYVQSDLVKDCEAQYKQQLTAGNYLIQRLNYGRSEPGG